MEFHIKIRKWTCCFRVPKSHTGSRKIQFTSRAEKIAVSSGAFEKTNWRYITSNSRNQDLSQRLLGWRIFISNGTTALLGSIILEAGRRGISTKRLQMRRISSLPRETVRIHFDTRRPSDWALSPFLTFPKNSTEIFTGTQWFISTRRR